MTKRMNMSIEGQEPTSGAPVDTVFRLEKTDAGIVLRAKTPTYDWRILTIKEDGTLHRSRGMSEPFQGDSTGGHRILLSE